MIPNSDPNKFIAERIHEVIEKKKSVWKLISDSYVGGTTYTCENYLHHYPREPETEYKARKKRSIYLNHVQPLADILAGFIFTNKPERKTPTALDYLKEKCSKQKSFDKFMLSLAIHSVQYPVGILVDSPSFDPALIKTEAQRQELKLNPFCTMYMPWKIRDFALDDNGDFLWVLLDNTYILKTDPKADAVKKVVYTLWDKESYQDFEITGDAIIQGEKYSHPVGKVPFYILSWKDKDEDQLSETPFEDIALIDQAVYNSLSLLDEMITAGTFKLLFFPVIKATDLPVELKTNGVGSLTVIPFPGDTTTAPFFAGASLEDTASFVSIIEFYLSQLFDKLGMGTDKDKKYVQSGKAKELDFKKAESFLRHGAESLQDCETFIFDTAARWEGKSDLIKKINITYSTDFQDEEIESLMTSITGIIAMGYKSLEKYAIMKGAELISKDDKPEKRKQLMDELEKEIEEKSKLQKLDTGSLSDAELQARENKASQGDGGNDE